MKRFIIAITLIFAFAITASSQDKKEVKEKLPKVDVKTLNGETFSTGDIDNDGSPIIISFWATWCKPCIRELSTIAEEYDDWVEETGVKLIAISIDDSRTSPNVKPFVNGKGWEYDVYIDANQDLKRAMNVNNVPHTFVLNKDLEIVWKHSSFSEGDELELIEIVRKVKNGEEISH